MKKVIRANYAGGVVSRIAHCYVCDWTCKENDPRTAAKIKKHVRETGHLVALEKAVVTYYILEEK